MAAQKVWGVALFAIILGAASLACAAIWSGSSTSPAPANGYTCVPLPQIDQTPAIDSRTVLLKLKGGRYLRMDLQNNCSGITFHGFGFSTSTQDLCTTDALRVNEVAGATCMIKQIVPISREEADVLQKRRH
jgi:hypothetical protein